MNTVKGHYENFLGPVYSWILGDFAAAYEKNVALFAELKLSAAPGDLAIDLGAGPGCQSIPLAEIGFDVIAVDFCQGLLDEMKIHAGNKSIRAVCADVVEFTSNLETAAKLIVCMGDTLVHLQSTAAVSKLLGNVSNALSSGGMFIYSIRDYTGHAPEGADRFVPLRADDEQIFTCFLDFRNDVVHVHDILYRKVDGSWKMQISDYLKLRLDATSINNELERNGLEILCEERHQGMITVVARKSA